MKKSIKKPVTRSLCFSLPDDTYELIRAKALLEKMSVTAWIRRALGGKPRRKYVMRKAFRENLMEQARAK
jgi:hypothetical protein